MTSCGNSGEDDWREIVISQTIKGPDWLRDGLFTPAIWNWPSAQSKVTAVDDTTRSAIADSLDELAAQDAWNGTLWQKCYELVSANVNEDELLGYVYDDIIHYSGRRLFRSVPVATDFNAYRQEFRNVATALRCRMSLAEYKRQCE